MEEYGFSGPVAGSDIRNTLSKTFLWMFMGVLATAITAVYTFSSGLAIKFALEGTFAIIGIIQIVAVLVFSLIFRKASPTVVTVLFFAYSMLTGVTLSTIFLIYELETIIISLFASAGIFGILAYMGYNTNKDISSFGTILTVGLMIGLLLSIRNLFIGSSKMAIVLDWVILGIFLGFTFYDMNKIKGILESGMYDQEKVSIYGAMELYLDFINIFIRILSLMARSRD